jgi:iron complex transport system ATP-binding protein
MPILKARNLTFFYGKQKILEDVDFYVESGEAVFLLGPNGSGKTTLLKLLLGFYRPSRGEVLLSGNPILNMSRRRLAKTIAYVPQGHRVSFGYRVLDVVLMGRTPHNPFFSSYSKRDLELALEYLERLSIRHLKDKPYTMVSGGERKLTLIARALVQEAKILVLDEPADGLDFGNQLRLLEHIVKVCKGGLSCVLTTHLIDHALWAGDRAILLKDGRVLASGPPEKTLTEELIKKLYGADIKQCTLMNGMKVCVPRGLGEKFEIHAPSEKR